MTATSQGKDHIFEYRFMKKSGEYLWLRDEVIVILESGSPTRLRGFMTDITDLKEREEHIRYISYHDELTGLYNRRFFEEELKRHDHPRNLPLTIVMGDMNNLKQLNDTHGHEVGDQYLKHAATIIEASARGTDIVTRWGGDEFVLIMPKADSTAATKLVSRINSKIDMIELEYGPVSLAFGYETKTDNKEDIHDIFRLAEKKMYKNKKKNNDEFDTQQ